MNARRAPNTGKSKKLDAFSKMNETDGVMVKEASQGVIGVWAPGRGLTFEVKKGDESYERQGIVQL